MDTSAFYLCNAPKYALRAGDYILIKHYGGNATTQYQILDISWRGIALTFVTDAGFEGIAVLRPSDIADNVTLDVYRYSPFERLVLFGVEE